MAACFSLTKRGETTPASLVSVDEAICAHVGRQPDPQKYVWDWFDYVGFPLAVGRSWADIREQCEDFPELLQIIDFLEANYLPNAWAQ